jgi:autotransporter strand-loop-strand O-heptosyltransferase
MPDIAPETETLTETVEVSSSTPPSSASGASKPNFPAPAELPTQKGPHGIRYDINHGARVVLPSRTIGSWRVRLTDLDTGNILFQSDNKGAFIRSSKRFFVRFGIEIWEVEEDGTTTSIFNHEQEVRDREVLIHLPVGTLGDTMGWFPYAARFAEVTGARVTVSLSKLILPLFRDAYPNLTLVSHEDAEEQKLGETAYATYCIGLFFDDTACEWQPTDFRHVGLHRTAGYILGIDPTEEAPRLVLPDESRPIPEPYICIAVQASTQAKMWNNPNGWREVIAFLKERGFRVICIDQKPVHGQGIVWNHIPHGAEDETGDRPLAERARWLRHASAFIGLSSGLAWLAWAAGCPTVMISGFTHPNNEFDTPYRIINWHTCNSCWNDVRHRFDHKDYLYCPRHKGTDRQMECTRLITGTQVINTLKRVPAIAARA